MRGNTRERPLPLHSHGFTLLEILIALFIFSILSLLLMHALSLIIDLQKRTENKADVFRSLQITLVILSRDIDQIIDRPILNHLGKKEEALLGKRNSIALTHAEIISPFDNRMQSGLQRVRYRWDKEQQSIMREVWPVLDQAPQTKVEKARRLLNKVTHLEFQYIDDEGHPHSNWPPEQEKTCSLNTPLPQAIEVTMTLTDLGKISQFYLIHKPIEPTKQKHDH